MRSYQSSSNFSWGIALLCILPLLGAGLCFLRWWEQGTKNLYTRLHDRFYLPSPNGDWSFVSDGAPWLGLDSVLALTFAALVISVLAWFFIRKGRPGLTAILWLPALASVALPIWISTQGLRPVGAVTSPPKVQVSENISGITATLPARAGLYQVPKESKAEITAQVKAGGEVFDARFADGIEGQLEVNPSNLALPVKGVFSVPADSVDTGVGLRNKHAREKLLSKAHPKITFTLTKISAAANTSKSKIECKGLGEITLAGITKSVKFSATIETKPTGETQTAAETEPAKQITGASRLWIDATMDFSLKGTALSEGDTFDESTVPIRVRVPLVHAGN